MDTRHPYLESRVVTNNRYLSTHQKHISQIMDDESEILEEIAGLNIAKETVFKLKKDEKYGR